MTDIAEPPVTPASRNLALDAPDVPSSRNGRRCQKRPPLTLEQMDLLIEAAVMEDFMVSMGWDPKTVVCAEDWPALDDMSHAHWLTPKERATAQSFRDQKVRFFVPDIGFLTAEAAHQQPEAPR